VIGGSENSESDDSEGEELLHGFSLNGRWLVFFIKDTPRICTHMYLTHIDANGNDNPAILIENPNAPNRGVNISESLSLCLNSEAQGESFRVPGCNAKKRRCRIRLHVAGEMTLIPGGDRADQFGTRKPVFRKRLRLFTHRKRLRLPGPYS
jgi:hypothetical protein